MEVKTLSGSTLYYGQRSFVLSPQLQPILKRGSLYYSETDRARTILRLGKKIVEEFRDLQGKQPVKYRLEYYRDENDFLGRVSKMLEEKRGLPFLLFLEKET